MKFCPNCGAELNAQNHFCPKCGNEITPKQSKDASAITTTKSSGKQWLFNLIYLLAAGFVLYFLISTYISPAISARSVDMEDLIGTWHDPTGVLLGDASTLIYIKESDGNLIGQDNGQIILIELKKSNRNRFEGYVTLRGMKTIADAEYDKEDQKLIFTNKLSKLDWYIKKKE